MVYIEGIKRKKKLPFIYFYVLEIYEMGNLKLNKTYEQFPFWHDKPNDKSHWSLHPHAPVVFLVTFFSNNLN